MVSTTSDETAAVEVQQLPPTTEEIKQISEEEFEKAQKTFQLGKKNLFLNKFDESVNNIDEACKIYSAKYGDIDPKCAEVYFFYGRALLELARVENNVLGNALDGVPEDNEPINDSRYGDPDKVPEEEQEEICEKVIDALCEKREGEKTTTENETKSEKSEEVEKKAEETTEKTEEKTETKAEEKTETTEKNDEETAEAEEECEEEEAEEDGEPTDEQKEEADDENDEISSLQRAWEMFELAKLIYSKHFENDLIFKNKRIAECLVKLGEISIEQETYEQAVNDITESIRIQEEMKSEERDERMLAESYYQLGLAQQFNNQFAESKESFQKSINIMQFRIEKLRSKLEACKPDETAEKTTIGDEIKDLEALLPEMNSKLEELAEQSEQTKNLVKECLGGAVNGSTAAPVTNGEVKDITSLVKSKRKISSSNLEDGTKKTKTECENESSEADSNNEKPCEEKITETAVVEEKASA